MAYGSCQARGQIGAGAADLHHEHSNLGSKPCLWTTPTSQGNAGSLMHWVVPGIEPTSSWILVRFVIAEPQWELLNSSFLNVIYLFHFCILNSFLNLSYLSFARVKLFCWVQGHKVVLTISSHTLTDGLDCLDLAFWKCNG